MTPPRSTDPVPVILARMEGVLNLVSYKVDGVVARVDHHEKRIGELTLEVQRLGDQAQASAETVVKTAEALKNAKETQDAQTRSEMAKSEQFWTPWARVTAVLSATAGVAYSIYTIFHH